MKEKKCKKILIVGSSATEYTLAKKMSGLENISEVFVAPGNDAMKEFCSIVDIREDNIEELLEFALENDIDLTIVSGELTIKKDIAAIFHHNGQMIFAPSKESSNIALSRSCGKKFMYKNRIPCPKFGIFDKPNFALDYVKKSNMPIVIKTDFKQNKSVLVCNSFSAAKDFIENLFEQGEKKVIIEDFISGHEFSFYVLTDGYHALPLGSSAVYKWELEGNGGALSSGMGAFVPDYKISSQVEKNIMQQIIYPTLNSLSMNQIPYVGILGVDLIMTEDERFYAINFNSFIKSPESQCILSVLNENLYNLFQACSVGSLADDYERLNISDENSVSCVIYAKKEGVIIQGLDDLDEETKVAHFNTRKNAYLEYETVGGRTIVLTRKARVLSKAVKDLYEEIPLINFDGMKYRKDIGEILID